MSCRYCYDGARGEGRCKRDGCAACCNCGRDLRPRPCTAGLLQNRLRRRLHGRIAMNLRTLRVHPEKWAREIARQRVLAYRTALEDLDRLESEYMAESGDIQ